MYGEGISREGCIVDMAVEAGVAKKSGAWYTYGEERLGQGREAAKQTLKENPDLREEIELKVREAFDIPVIERGEGEASVSLDAWQEHAAQGPEVERERALALLRRRPPRAKNARDAAFRKLVGQGYSTDVAGSVARQWAEEQG